MPAGEGQGASRYVPAAGRRGLTRFYDPVMRLTMREGNFRGQLLDAVAEQLPQGGVVVDVGCGTGTFTTTMVERLAGARVVGVDGDAEVLAIAAAKDSGQQVSWSKGPATELPLDDQHADAVVMSLLLHHLDPQAKYRALAEAWRVLQPGGVLHVADWGRPRDPVMRGSFLLLQLLDGFPNTRDHAAGRLPGMIEAAGFSEVVTRARLRTAWGSLELLSARRPG